MPVIPPFRAHFSTPRGILVVSSNKCASTFLNSFLVKDRKYESLPIWDDSSNELLNHDPSTHTKIFIYRDPVDRIFGWYDGFIYTYGSYIEVSGEYITLYTTARKLVSFQKDMIENLHHFLTSHTVKELQELFEWDQHTTPLCRYFEYTDSKVDDYQILDMYDLHAFTQDRYGVGGRVGVSKKVVITIKNIALLNEISEILASVYKKDLKMLYPQVKPYRSSW